MRIRDILRQKKQRELITIEEDNSLLEACQRLAEHHIGVLLVLKKGENPAGIISERDIVRASAQKKGDISNMPVLEAMTTDLITCTPDDDLNYVMNVMTKQRIRHLPVMDGNDLIGLVSIGDVIKAQMSESETEIRYLRSYITGIPDA